MKKTCCDACLKVIEDGKTEYVFGTGPLDICKDCQEEVWKTLVRQGLGSGNLPSWLGSKWGLIPLSDALKGNT